MSETIYLGIWVLIEGFFFLIYDTACFSILTGVYNKNKNKKIIKLSFDTIRSS